MFGGARLGRRGLVAALAGLMLAFFAVEVPAQVGFGPKCDFQFCRKAKRAARVCMCFLRQNGARQVVCINVDGICDPSPPGLPSTPTEMAAAMTAAINATPGLMATDLGSGIVCAMAKPGTSPIKCWTVVTRDGQGGLLKEVGPGPTDPLNPGGPPPPPLPGEIRLPPKIQINGTPVSPATLEVQAFGGPLVSLPIPPATPMSVAGAQLTAALNAAGYQAIDQGLQTSFLGDTVEVIELLALPGGALPEKILEIGYDETTPGPSDLGSGIELGSVLPAKVPTLSGWALALLATSLTFVGVLFLARRARRIAST